MDKLEESWYEIATNEVLEDKPIKAILGKAFSEAMGDKEKIRSLYIKYRVAQLREVHIRLAGENVRRTLGVVGENVRQTITDPNRWYFRTSAIVVIFLILGPLALPLVLINPRYSGKKKCILIILLILAYIIMLWGSFCIVSPLINKYFPNQ